VYLLDDGLIDVGTRNDVPATRARQIARLNNQVVHELDQQRELIGIVGNPRGMLHRAAHPSSIEGAEFPLCHYSADQTGQHHFTVR
jgi:hypothetical protein